MASPWEIEPGIHAHICEQQDCGYCWTHSEQSLNNRDDHTCPRCGTLLPSGWFKAYPHEARQRLAEQAKAGNVAQQ